MIPYALVKHVEVAEAKIGEYVHLIRSGRIGPVVDGKRLTEYPVQVVPGEDGPSAVVLSVGDPRVEVVRDDAGGAVLVGTWGEHRVERQGEQYGEFLAAFGR